MIRKTRRTSFMKLRCQTRAMYASDPSPINDVALVSDGGAIISSQEEGQTRHVVRHQDALQGLRLHDVSFIVGRVDTPLLSRRRDGARHDTVDPDAIFAELMRMGPGQTHDARVAGGVDG